MSGKLRPYQLRPGEGVLLPELLISKRRQIQITNCKSGGFEALSEFLVSQELLRDMYAVNFFVMAENHQMLSRDIIVMYLPNDTDPHKALTNVLDNFWFGGKFAQGFYLEFPLQAKLMNKLGITGRLSRNLRQMVGGVLISPPKMELESSPSMMDCMPFNVELPNCRLTELPYSVKDAKSLGRWMMLSNRIFKSPNVD